VLDVTGFPPGARVLVDGRDVAIVRQHFPQGSSSYGFAHYKVDMVDGDRNVAVAIKRLGVVTAKPPFCDTQGAHELSPQDTLRGEYRCPGLGCGRWIKLRRSGIAGRVSEALHVIVPRHRRAPPKGAP
jgi:hypothetical protein